MNTQTKDPIEFTTELNLKHIIEVSDLMTAVNVYLIHYGIEDTVENRKHAGLVVNHLVFETGPAPTEIWHAIFELAFSTKAPLDTVA